MSALNGQLLLNSNWFWVTSFEVEAAFCSFFQLNLNNSHLTKLKNLVKNCSDLCERDCAGRGRAGLARGSREEQVKADAQDGYSLQIHRPALQSTEHESFSSTHPKIKTLTLGGRPQAGACAGVSPGLGPRASSRFVSTERAVSLSPR